MQNIQTNTQNGCHTKIISFRLVRQCFKSTLLILSEIRFDTSAPFSSLKPNSPGQRSDRKANYVATRRCTLRQWHSSMPNLLEACAQVERIDED